MFTTVSIVEAPHLGQRHLNQNYRNYNHKVMLLLHDFKPLQCSQYFYYQNGSNDYSHVKRFALRGDNYCSNLQFPSVILF